MVTEANLLSKVVKNKVAKTDSVAKAMYGQFRQVSTDATIGEVSRILDKDHFLLVTNSQRCYSSVSVRDDGWCRGQKINGTRIEWAGHESSGAVNLIKYL